MYFFLFLEVVNTVINHNKTLQSQFEKGSRYASRLSKSRIMAI
jgi:hypothetical protein